MDIKFCFCRMLEFEAVVLTINYLTNLPSLRESLKDRETLQGKAEEWSHGSGNGVTSRETVSDEGQVSTVA